ncbi:MAG: C40 family peptidase [Salinimicrobium sp.]
MKRLLLLLMPLLLISCGAHKTRFSAAPEAVVNEEIAGTSEEPEVTEYEEAEVISEEDSPGFDLIATAKDFIGTAYKYGGTSSAGMDCSGLVYSVFLLKDVVLPHSSRAMAQLGEKLSLDKVSPGDLVFFETGRKKNVISHVGMVVELEEDKIFFIHSTTSRGVIISSLDENYWQQHFVMARRIL